MFDLSRHPRYQKLRDGGYSDDELTACGFIEEPFELVHLHPPFPSINGKVLIMTGCFAPFHDGHRAALRAAKDYLEKGGEKVELALVAPCHEEYVATKTEEWKSTHKRGMEFQKLRDPWMRLFWFESSQKGPINFTTVYDEARNIYGNRLVFVCGSDNYRFAECFNDREPVFIITRNEDKIQPLKPNVVILQTEHATQSSTNLRNSGYL